jgi:CsoR family transcriptional regulator, copper-sensing transcriptional repressor
LATDNESDDLIVRLRRIEGQIKGIQKMMEERRPCREVLTQIMAARSSLDQVGVQVFQREVADCLKTDTPEGNEQIHQLQDTIKLWSKMA